MNIVDSTFVGTVRGMLDSGNEISPKMVGDLLDLVNKQDMELARVKKKSTNRRLALRGLNMSVESLSKSFSLYVDQGMKREERVKELLQDFRNLREHSDVLREDKKRLMEFVSKMRSLASAIDHTYLSGREVFDISSEITKGLTKVGDIKW